MYLTKIELDKCYPSVRRAIADRQHMHAVIQKMFSTDRKTSDVLFRLTDSGLYIGSRVRPKELLGEGFSISYIRELNEPENGSLHRFSLVAIPRKAVNSKKRVLRTEAERIGWLAKKGKESGFEIRSVREEGKEPIRSDRKGFSLDAYKYSGILQVTDQALFDQARLAGFGPMKAYGCGFLMIV